MHWKNLVNYEFLGSYSLEGIAEEITLTISKIEKKLVTGPNGKQDFCIVFEFEEKNKDGVVVKPMVVNKTNCKTIERIYGTGDTDKWIGKRITIFASTTKYQRDMVPCLRVKSEIPKEEKYYCSVCNKEIDLKTHKGSIAKYGRAICSAECLNKINEKGEEK